MKKSLSILLLFFVSCGHKESIDKNRFILSIKNYYLLQTKDIKSVEDVSIDSIVPVTEKKQLEIALLAKEKKYNYFIEAKDDEFADSTARDMEQIQPKLKTAENSVPVFYTVYHTVKFTGSDMIRRARQSNLDLSTDYKIQANEVTEIDKTQGIKAGPLYKQYSY